MIVNPNYKPEPHARLALEENLKSSLERTGKKLDRKERMMMSEQIAEKAVEALFSPISTRLINANEIRKNQPGYDYLIDDKLRIQVKGSTFAECVQWTHKGKDPSLACLGYDFIIVVDIGATLKKSFGRLEKYDIETKETVDYYVISNADILKYLEICRQNKVGKIIYWYKRELNQDTKEYRLQYHDLPRYKNKFDELNRSITGSFY